jgi:hypothetical protein
MRATVTLMLKLHPYGSCREERQGPQLAPTRSAGERHSFPVIEGMCCKTRRRTSIAQYLNPIELDFESMLRVCVHP